MRTHEHAAAAATNAGDTSVSARRILIADDYPNAAESLARWLRRMGNEVHTAVDGKEALEIAEKLRPEVVLLDLGMPKINGYEAAERIRSQAWGREMVLVALTGWGQDEDRERTSLAGFNIHLVKPIDYGRLATLLQTLEER
jgi:CheY-like chemotaxis protein